MALQDGAFVDPAAPVKYPRPLQDRVLVERVKDVKDTTASGLIVIPDAAKVPPQEAIVRAVGKGRIENGQRLEMDIQVGDRILYGKFSGVDVKIEDREYLILREDEVMAVL